MRPILNLVAAAWMIAAAFFLFDRGNHADHAMAALAAVTGFACFAQAACDRRGPAR